MLCTFHTSLFLWWEIKSWESCLVIRRVLSHAQQYALFPSCLCRDCASQWMGEWKIWEKGKTLALSQVDRSNDDFCQGVFLRRNWTQKNFMNAKGMLTRTSESPGFPTIEQNIFQSKRVRRNFSDSFECWCKETYLASTLRSCLSPVVVPVLIWSCLSFSFAHPFSYNFVHSGIKRDNDIGDTVLDE